MTIGVIVAMDKEFVQLRTILEQPIVERKNGKDFVLGNIGTKRIVLQKCGMGGRAIVYQTYKVDL